MQPSIKVQFTHAGRWSLTSARKPVKQGLRLAENPLVGIEVRYPQVARNNSLDNHRIFSFLRKVKRFWTLDKNLSDYGWLCGGFGWPADVAVVQSQTLGATESWYSSFICNKARIMVRIAAKKMSPQLRRVNKTFDSKQWLHHLSIIIHFLVHVMMLWSYTR